MSPFSNVGRRQSILSRIQLLRQRMSRLRIYPGGQLVPRNVGEFVIHKSTTLILTLVSIAMSVSLIVVSIFQTQLSNSTDKRLLDSSFYATFSQAVLSLLTIYLTALPPLRSRSLRLRYKAWFWGCSLMSALASIASVGIYPSRQSVSAILAYGASFAQVVVTLLLVECVEKAVQDGSIGGVELD